MVNPKIPIYRWEGEGGATRPPPDHSHELSKRDIRNEHRIYQALPPRAPFLALQEGSTEEALVLPYLAHGNLADFLHDSALSHTEMIFPVAIYLILNKKRSLAVSTPLDTHFMSWFMFTFLQNKTTGTWRLGAGAEIVLSSCFVYFTPMSVYKYARMVVKHAREL